MMGEEKRQRPQCRRLAVGLFVLLLATANGCLEKFFGPDGDANAIVEVEISPSSVTLASGSSEAFNVTVRDTSGTSVALSDVGLSWSATGGSITADGTYTAGDVTGDYRVVVAESSGLADTAGVTVTMSSGTTVSNIVPTYYGTATLEPGVRIYVDRSFTAVAVPANYGGWLLIQTANEDKSATSADAISFDLAESATVAIAYDKRATALPGWLAEWQETGHALTTSDAPTSPMPIRSKVLGPGRVHLGGNMSDGAAGAESMYVIFVHADSGGDTQVGSLLVAVSTTGAGADPNGYTVFVDEVQSKSVGTNGSVTFYDLSVGTHSIRLTGLASNCSVVGANPRNATVSEGETSTVAIEVTCNEVSTPAIAVPTQSDWTDHGVVVSGGSSGAWDAYLEGFITPSVAIKKDGKYFLYYGGATGVRPDGGPANRALGVAVSTDGYNYTKHSNNPIVTHQPSAPNGQNVIEEGIFSAGGWLDDDGTVTIYVGGMEAIGAADVDGDAVLAVSSDGLEFTVVGDVIRHGASGVIGTDEVFPLGAFERDDGTWHCYYTAKGGVTSWTMVLASGPARNTLPNIRRVTGPAAGTFKGAGDPILLSDSRVLVPVKTGFGPGQDIVLRSTTIDQLDVLSTVETTYNWSNVDHVTILLDREEETWFLFYKKSGANAIGLKTAPVTFE
jgi:hypothetical protein